MASLHAIVIASALLACSQKASCADLFQQSVALYNHKRYPEAAQKFAEVLKAQPSNAHANYYLAGAILQCAGKSRQERGEAARHHYLQAIKLTKDVAFQRLCEQGLRTADSLAKPVGVTTPSTRPAIASKPNAWTPPHIHPLPPYKLDGADLPFGPDVDPRNEEQIQAWRIIANPRTHDQRVWANRLPPEVVDALRPKPILRYPLGVDSSEPHTSVPFSMADLLDKDDREPLVTYPGR